MRKKIFTALIIATCLPLVLSGQESRFANPDYYQWSIEGGVGFHRPYNSFTDGYYSATPDFFLGNIGVRYMFNELFGMKFGLMYDRYSSHDNSLGTFNTNQYGFSLSGVANIGRLLKFEEWTGTFNLLSHYGLGISVLDFENAEENDWVANSHGGLTLQAKVSPRVTLFGDVTAMENFSQDVTFDGLTTQRSNLPVVFKGSVGVSVALGRSNNNVHADYYIRDSGFDRKLIDELASKVDKVESDVEELDQNQDAMSGRIDKLTERMDKVERDLADVASTRVVDVDALLEQMIKDGYFNIYFDFDDTDYNKISASTINLLKTFMENNPGVNVDLLGYADERGTEEYNRGLSQRRADAVKEALVNVGVPASRLNAIGMGEDRSIDSTSEDAYQLARRVTFSIR